MRIFDLICEARGDLLTHLMKMYQRGEENIRFRGYVEAVGEKEFCTDNRPNRNVLRSDDNQADNE